MIAKSTDIKNDALSHEVCLAIYKFRCCTHYSFIHFTSFLSIDVYFILGGFIRDALPKKKNKIKKHRNASLLLLWQNFAYFHFDSYFRAINDLVCNLCERKIKENKILLMRLHAVGLRKMDSGTLNETCTFLLCFVVSICAIFVNNKKKTNLKLKKMIKFSIFFFFHFVFILISAEMKFLTVFLIYLFSRFLFSFQHEFIVFTGMHFFFAHKIYC